MAKMETAASSAQANTAHFDGSGTQNLQVGQNFGSIAYHSTGNSSSIDQAWLRAFRGPDTLAVKNRLKESKDKLLPAVFSWILDDQCYRDWKDGDTICLLWIKGGAGKGKTMMSIGITEMFSQKSTNSSLVTYFFCQYADHGLNTLEAIVKGLILRLVSQQETLKKHLRDKWDAAEQRFTIDVTSWRQLWDIFMAMLDDCPRVYVIIDALDECRDDGLTDLLRLIVRAGLDRPSRIKWLFTSRPLERIEREILPEASDQVLVSLDLNQEHISNGISTYISSKVAELDRRHRYKPILRQSIETELGLKAEGTFLWVDLVCKDLDDIPPDKALSAIRGYLPGLHPFYERALSRLCHGPAVIVEGSKILLQAMMLVYRPLQIDELGSVTGTPHDQTTIRAIIDRCASFIGTRNTTIEFVHQSARDYLASDSGKALLEGKDQFGHREIATNCLRDLSLRLRKHPPDLPRQGSVDSTKAAFTNKPNNTLTTLAYASTFWVWHLHATERSFPAEDFTEEGRIGMFLRHQFLEWLESLSLLDRLPYALETLELLAGISGNILQDRENFVSRFVHDAVQLLLRHYETISLYPSQIYSSVIILAPEESMVRTHNKVPSWVTNLPKVGHGWTALRQTLVGHDRDISFLAVSPDERRIVSVSIDDSMKVWDAITGKCHHTLHVGSIDNVGSIDIVGSIDNVAFSSDGRLFVSRENIINVWNIINGECEKTLISPSSIIRLMTFILDGRLVETGPDDEPINIWDVKTWNFERVPALKGFRPLLCSPNGQWILWQSRDKSMKIWDTATGKYDDIPIARPLKLEPAAVSPDGKWIVISKVWGGYRRLHTSTGEIEKTPIISTELFSSSPRSSPSGWWIAVRSGIDTNTIEIRDATTGICRQTLVGHSADVYRVAFSPSGRLIVSSSVDGTVKIWDVMTMETFDMTSAGHPTPVREVMFSPDRKCVLSVSSSEIRIWNTIDTKQRGSLSKSTNHDLVAAFSPNGQRVVIVTRDRKIEIWDITLTKCTMTIGEQNKFFISVAYSPDGRLLASGGRYIDIWDATTGDCQKTSQARLFATAIAWSPDSQLILSGHMNGEVKIWGASNLECRRVLANHDRYIRALAFSFDGQWIASAGINERVSMWSVTEALKPSRILGTRWSKYTKFTQCRTIPHQEEGVIALRFTQDGHYLKTNCGFVNLRAHTPAASTRDTGLSNHLYIRDGWIWCGSRAILRLAGAYEPACYTSDDDQIVVGFKDGRVLSFTIDRAAVMADASLEAQNLAFPRELRHG